MPSARPETERVQPFALLAPHAAVDQAVPDDGGALVRAHSTSLAMVTVWVAAVAGSYDGPVVLSAGGALTVHDALLLVPVPPDPRRTGGRRSRPRRTAPAVRAGRTPSGAAGPAGAGCGCAGTAPAVPRFRTPASPLAREELRAVAGRPRSVLRSRRVVTRPPITRQGDGRTLALALSDLQAFETACARRGWSHGDSNPEPPPCKGGALPVELWPRVVSAGRAPSSPRSRRSARPDRRGPVVAGRARLRRGARRARRVGARSLLGGWCGVPGGPGRT